MWVNTTTQPNDIVFKILGARIFVKVGGMLCIILWQLF